MSTFKSIGGPHRVLVLLVGAAIVLPTAAGRAQFANNNGGFFRQNSVGGISIDAQGVVAQPSVHDQQLYRSALLEAAQVIPDELGRASGLRMISLRGLEEAISRVQKDPEKVLPDEIWCLAGIQRIEYVLVYPEKNDIVLAGPGEGWKVDEKGNVVGVTTGRPVLQLDDLLVALQSVEDARRVGISCSIDPTPKGRRNFDAFMHRQRTFGPRVVAGAAKALGAQKITLTGVPEASHFARVLVAADYRMKRIAMKLDRSPVRGLPSYVDMLRAVPRDAMPRWWLACNYEPLQRSEDGLVWRLRGPGVKTMTEDEFLAADGTVASAGRANPVAQRWADLMTEKYDELATRDVVFGQLRNLMDMCVVAALVAQEGLLDKAGCNLPLLTGVEGSLVDDGWNAPKTIATQCSFTKKSGRWIITASGGVQIESWQAAAKSVVNDAVKEVRTRAAAPERHSWRWN